MDQERFAALCREYMEWGSDFQGIGTLREKSLHAVLKKYYQPVESGREVRVGKYIADGVTRDGCILEVQTGKIAPIRKKLECFLERYQVILVHPVGHTRWLQTVDPESGVLSPKRKSPSKGSVWDGFRELASVPDLLCRPNLKLCMPLVNLEEMRIKHSRRKSRLERFPVGLVKEYWFGCPEDYIRLLPEALPARFTSLQLAQAEGISRETAQFVLYTLFHGGFLERDGKDGRSYLYRIPEVFLLAGEEQEEGIL